MNTSDDLPGDNLPYIDLHCHPSMKPFGLACPGNTNSPDASLMDSIWYDDPPTSGKIKLADAIGITRFSQANFTALYHGNFKIVVVALNPIEKGFFPVKLKSNPVSYLVDHATNRTHYLNLFLEDFISGIGKKKIKFIQNNFDDFNELNCEYEFYRQLDNTPLTTYGKKVRYKLTSVYNDIETNLKSNKDVISVVFSIEGANLFSNDNRNPIVLSSVLSNIDIVKQWQHPPFFVTLCHHFFNYLGGQAKSLPNIISKRLGDGRGSDTDLLHDGEQVIYHLLNKSNGRRIFIDIKHMNRKVREAYYKILEERYNTEQIPIIVSHGALNGYLNPTDSSDAPRERNGLFNGREINFYDCEIVKIAKSGGIFGLQLDKRQITNKCEYRKIKYLCRRKNKARRWTSLVWNQIRHIADILDSNNLPAWNITCLGTDFDGMITPIDQYCTSDRLHDLFTDLLPFARDYVEHKTFRFLPNKIPAEKILKKIFSENAKEFLKKYY